MSDTQESRTLTRLIKGGGKQMLSVVPTLMIYPIIARMLTDEELGVWTLIGAAGFMLILTDLGLSNAVKRAAVTDDEGLARRTLGFTLLVNLTLLPLAIVALFYTMLDFSDVGQELRDQALLASGVMMVGGAIGAIANPYMDFVYAKGGSDVVARARITAASFQIVVISVGFWQFDGVVVPAAAASLAKVISIGFMWSAARSYDPQIPLLPVIPKDRGEALRSLRDGAAALAINAAVVMALRIDYKVLEWAATHHALQEGGTKKQAAEKALVIVGRYGLAGLVVDMAYSLAKQANTALMRQLGRPEERSTALRIGTVIFSSLIMAGMAAIMFDGQSFLEFVLGDKAEGLEVATILFILGTGAMVLSTYEVAGAMVMLGSKSAWSCATPIVVGSLVNLVISVTASRYVPMYGIPAVAGSTLIGNMVSTVLMWRTAVKIVGWSRRDTVAVFSPIIAAASVAVGLAFALRPWANMHPAISLGACALVTAAGALTMYKLGRGVWKHEEDRAETQN